MTPSKITNDVLYNEIMHIKSKTERIEQHLSKLNGKVVDNQLIIEKLNTNQNGIIKWFTIIGGGVVAGVITLFFKLFGGN